MDKFINESKEVILNNKTEETNHEPSVVANAFFVFALFVVLVINLLGNSMVLYVVYHQWKNVKQRVTHSFIANLAGIDLLVAILVLFSIIQASRGNKESSYTKCQIGGFLGNLVGASSIATMAVIAIDRYLVIVLNHRRRLKLRSARIIIACVWTISILASLLPILFWGKYRHTGRSTQCKPDDGGFLLMSAIVFFLIPLATMIFCYVSIFMKVRRHKQMISGTLKRQCSFQTEFRTTKIVFTVLATFLVLWTPYVIVYVSSSNSDKDSIPPGVFKFCGFLTAMHSMCNPIIYFKMNRNFRRTAIKVLRRIFSCARVLSVNEDSTITGSVCNEKASYSSKDDTLCASGKTLHVHVLTNELSKESNI